MVILIAAMLVNVILQKHRQCCFIHTVVVYTVKNHQIVVVRWCKIAFSRLIV